MRVQFTLLVLLLLLLAGFSTQAHAQTYDQCYTNTSTAMCPDRATAYAQVERAAKYQVGQLGGQAAICEYVTLPGPPPGRQVWYSSRCDLVPRHLQVTRSWPVGADCPGGGTWREDLGRCFDPAECEARNGAENGFPATDRTHVFKSDCLDGCEYKQQQGDCTAWASSPGTLMCSGIFQFTGEQCNVPPQGDNGEGELAPPGEDSCQTLASGMKACKKPDGRECVEANSGAMICWGVGETGQKTSGADAQTRGPGTQEPTPDQPTPPESFDPGKKKGPETSQTTTTNPNGSTTTTTTTTVNNSTTHGTKAPGVPGGPGSGKGKEGEDDKDGNKLEGGVACDQPPVASGDPLLGSIVLQTWKTRCQGEKAEKEFEETAASSEGDDASALDSIWNTDNSPLNLNPGLVTLPGGELLPSVELEGRTWTQPPEFYTALERIRMLIIAIATVMAMFIVGRNI